MAERVSLFSTGSQFADWTSKNCDHCKKAMAENASRYTCDIEKALWDAYMSDGKVDKAIAHRACYHPSAGGIGYYNWPCDEVESKTEDHAWSVADWRKNHDRSV